MTVVSVFEDPTKAHLARIWLAEAGVEAYVLDQHIIGLIPMLSPAIGGVRLVVSRDDSESARRILAALPERQREETQCPECSQRHVKTSQLGLRLAFLSILLMNVPIGRARRKFVCEDCGHSWRM